jgi:hypothetical protein
MPHKYNREAWLALTRFKTVASQFQSDTQTSQNYLRNARDLGEQTKGRLRLRAEEARWLSMQLPDPLAERLLLELAEAFDNLAR